MVNDDSKQDAANDDQATRMRDLLEETRRTLRGLGEELRKTAQVAQKDAEASWRDVKPKLDELEERLRDGLHAMADDVQSSELRVQLQLAMMEARDKWRELEPRVAPLVERVVSATEQALETAVDSIGNQAKDPNREEQWRRVKERAEAQRERLGKELGEAGKALEEAAETALQEMKGAFARLREQLGKKK